MHHLTPAAHGAVPSRTALPPTSPHHGLGATCRATVEPPTQKRQQHYVEPEPLISRRMPPPLEPVNCCRAHRRCTLSPSRCHPPRYLLLEANPRPHQRSIVPHAKKPCSYRVSSLSYVAVGCFRLALCSCVCRAAAREASHLLTRVLPVRGRVSYDPSVWSWARYHHRQCDGRRCQRVPARWTPTEHAPPRHRVQAQRTRRPDTTQRCAQHGASTRAAPWRLLSTAH